MDRTEALRMRLEGRTYQEIGERFGVSRQRVQQVLSAPKHIKELVIKRAGGKCEDCGIIIRRSPQIHHTGKANGPEDYQDEENLQLLCLSCHLRAHTVSEETKERQSENIAARRLRVYLKTGVAPGGLPKDIPD